jgi:hypothetical protein
MSRLGPVSSWSHSILVICVIDGVCILLNCCLEDGIPRQKRRKVSIPPLTPHKGDRDDIPMLAAENWRADQEVVAPMDAGDMIDLDYNIDGLTYLELSFTFWC